MTLRIFYQTETFKIVSVDNNYKTVEENGSYQIFITHDHVNFQQDQDIEIICAIKKLTT